MTGSVYSSERTEKGTPSRTSASGDTDEEREGDRRRPRDRQNKNRPAGSRSRSRESPGGGTLPNKDDSKCGEKTLSGDILNVIGKRLADERVQAPPIHTDFVVRWTDILKLGLPAEERDSLIKKYPPPSNCVFLDPPKLNPEVDRAINDVARIRDKRIVAKHQKLTACASGLSKLISVLLKRDTVDDVPIIEGLSDIFRLITDAMHDESAIRRSLILANVNASLKNTLSGSTPDDCLFGKDLMENLKAEKLIDQSAEELKRKKQSQSSSKNYKGPFRPSNKNNTGSSSGQN